MNTSDRLGVIEYSAREFHDTYERLAPEYGYKTRDASAVAWDDVPEQNKALMIATVDHVMRGAVHAGAVALIREVLIAATDIIPPGDEPFVGWSVVLAERIASALGGQS